MRSTRIIVGCLVAGLVFGTTVVTTPGCGGNDFLGLEDYQRDLLFGGLAAALLAQQRAQDGADPEPGSPGRDGDPGVNCWDLNGNGVDDPDEDVNGDGDHNSLDCQGSPGADGGDGTQGLPGGDGLNCWDLNGDGVADPAEDTNGDGAVDVLDCQGSSGSDGAPGADGSSGSDGRPGADGPEFFDIFIDDFFTFDPASEVLPVTTDPQLNVGVVSINEPALQFAQESPIAYRVAIPASYERGNDVTMRLFLYRTGFRDGECFIFTVDSRRLRNGSDIEVYGDNCNGVTAVDSACGRRWVRLDQDEANGTVGDEGGDPGTLIVVDLPLNTAAGLNLERDLADVDKLSGGDFLAFELNVDTQDSRSYQVLGVEFFESGAGSSMPTGATIFSSEELACCATPEPEGPLVYISNTGSDDVWVVDMATASVVGVVDVGDDPRGIDITPDNSRVYVANRFDGSVSVIDTATLTLAQTIDLAGSGIVSATEPYDVVVSSDGEWLYVAMKNGGSENGDGTVVVVDLPAGTVVAEVVLDGNASPEGLVVTPDGRKVYVAGRGDMYVVDVSSPTQPTFLGTSGRAGRELVVSRDGVWVYADNNAVRTSDDTAVDTGEWSGERGIDISPDGRFLYSTNQGSSVKVVEISMVGGLPATTFAANIDDTVDRQFDAYGIDLTDLGDLGVVSYRGNDTVRIFDTGTRSFVGAPIPMEFVTCRGALLSGSEPKQLVIDHTSNCLGGPDCNQNGIRDACDIADQSSVDCNANGIPDECELDCNTNGVNDTCDIADGTSFDCDQNGVPDECADCPPLDLVFVMDTSGSMDNEAAALCQDAAQVVQDLQNLGIDVSPSFLGITQDVDDDPQFPCLVDNVLDMLGGQVPNSSDVLDDTEDWGPATAIVAARFPWTAGAVRVIVPISDEDPQNGDGCNQGDTDAILNAIAAANAGSVRVSPILAELEAGNCDPVGDPNDCLCILPLATQLAAETGGTVFQSTDPGADLAGAINVLIVEVCRSVSDCNSNQIPDACEICAGEFNIAGIDCLPDCDSDGIPDECDDACVLQCEIGSNCDDQDPCTIDVCGDGRCINSPMECPTDFLCVDGVCVD